MGKRRRDSTSKEDRRERRDRKIRRLEKKLEREREKRYASSHKPVSRRYSRSSSRRSSSSETRRSRSRRARSGRPSPGRYRKERLSSECSSSGQSTSGRLTPSQLLAANTQQPDQSVLPQIESVPIVFKNTNAVLEDKELTGTAETETRTEEPPSIIPEHEIDLQQEVLEVIGSRLESDNKLADAIHKDVALRWAEILRNGLPAEEIKKLVEKYPSPQNCTILAVPKLNAEIIAAVQEAAIKRDKRIVEKQERIAASLGALGKAISIALKIEGAQRVMLIERLSDASRLIASVHREESMARKSLLLANLNTGLKDTLSNTSIDEWLFSGNLEGVIKSAKIIEQASKALKPPTKPRQQKSTKNWKGPTRQLPYKGRPSTSGRYRQSSSASSAKKPSQRKESSHHLRKRR